MRKYNLSKELGIGAVLAICMTLLFIGCGKQEGGQQVLEIDETLRDQVSDICGGEKYFYLATKNDILKYGEDGELEESFHFDEHAISNVAYGDGLYALDWLNGAILKLDKNGNVISELELGVELHSVYGMTAYGHILYLSCTVEEEDSFRDLTYCINMEKQTVEELMETYGCVYAEPSEGRYLLLAGGEMFEGSAGEKGEIQLERYDMLGQQVRSVAWDEKGRDLYFVRDNRVYALKDGNLELLHNLEIVPEKIAVAGKSLLLFQPKEGLVLTTMVADASIDTVVLNLYNIDDSYIDIEKNSYVDVSQEFEMQYNIQLDYIWEDTASYEKFLTDIMSGSDRYDIYMVSNMMGDSTGYKANHAYYDLSESEVLVEAVQGMYESVSAAAWNGEELFGLPIDVDGTIFCYNPDAYLEDEAGLYGNWESVLNMMEKADKSKMYNLHSGRVLGNIFDQYFSAYGNVEANMYSFDTPEFHEALKLMKRVAKMGLPDSVSSGGHQYGTVLAEDDILGWPELREYVMNPKYPIASPSIGKELGKWPVYQMFAVVNPNSKHKKEAIAYLEYLCQTERIQGNPLLYADENYSELVDFMENRMVSNFDWKISNAEIYPILWEYLKDEISEEELVERLTQNVNMQLNE